MKKLLPLLTLCMASLGGCVHEDIITINATPALGAVEDIEEALLLDVGISVFDPNVPEEVAEQNEMLLAVGVRNAEARYMPYVLRDSMQETGNWGAVRVVPRGSETVDLMIGARIITSDGETLTLEVSAYDASGRVWIDNREYTDLAGKLNYRDDINTSSLDPFQDLYNQVANDLLAERNKLSDKEIARIRQIAQLRFAADLAPDAFGDYLAEEKGRYSLRRLPARDDPMFLRTQKIRDRDYLFIDTLDQHFGSFHRQIDQVYDDWRKFNYDEVVELRRIEQEMTRRTLAGAAMIVGGVAAATNSDNNYTAYSGQVAAYMGMYAIFSARKLRPEALIHAQTIRELGDSFELEVRPAVLEIEGKTITLSGSVEAQFEQWRELLREIYDSETGLPDVASGRQALPGG